MMRLLSRKWFAAATAAVLAPALATGCSGGPAAPAPVTSSPSAVVTSTSTPPAAVSPSSLPTASAVGSARPSSPANGTEDFGPDAASFVSATQGWALAPGACGHCGVVYRTTDVGRHWSVVATPTLPGGKQALAQGLVDLYFADAQDGYIFTGYHCTSDCLLTTRDGGRAWHRVPLPAVVRLVRAGADLYALTARGPDQPLGLLRSTDGGRRWAGVSLPVTSRALDLAAQRDALALLRPSPAGTHPKPDQLGRLWYSADAASTWSARPNPCTTSDGGAALVSLALGHPAALLVDCFDNEQSSDEQDTQHHLYGSADTGRSWVRLADPTHVGEPVLMADNGAGHAFLATESIRNILAATLDGAAHWHTAITARPGFFGWGDLRLVSARVGFILGPTHYAPEHLYRTTDGGRTWQKLPLPGPPA